MESDLHSHEETDFALNESAQYVSTMGPHSNIVYGPIILCLVITSLIENVFFVLLTIKPLHRLCALRRRRQRFAFLARTRANITSLAYSLQSTVMPFPIQVSTPNPDFERYNKQNEERLAIPHAIAPYQRHYCRHRCISAESYDICRYHSLHRYTFYYFSSLCIAITLLMCATLLNVLIEFNECKGNSVVIDVRHTVQCLMAEVSITALIMVMSFSLVQLTTDRLIAICHPFHYWRIMSSWKCLLVIGVCWGVSIVFALIPYIHLRFNSRELTKGLQYCFLVGIQGFNGFYMYAYAYIAIVFIIPLCFILLAYTKIHQVANRSADAHEENHVRYLPRGSEVQSLSDSVIALKNHHVQCQNCQKDYLEPPQMASFSTNSRGRLFSNFSSPACSQEGESRVGAQYLNDYLRRAKAAKSAVLIVCSFYGLILPYMCMICFQSILVEFLECECLWLAGLEAVSIILVYAATIITPVTYALRDGALRKRLDCFFRNIKLTCAKKNIPVFS
nr:olfactory receptor 4P4 [Hymenolepis microstoma]